LTSEPNIHVLGSRPYADVPAYLQHANIVLVPHRVTPFTDSLDPIKAYECLAVARPTVTTPVAGFRELAKVVTVVHRESFVEAVRAVLGADAVSPPDFSVATWDDRAAVFENVLVRAGSG
jgi:teichuronic acid biosynthesis glycosyltransferase TuaH